MRFVDVTNGTGRFFKGMGGKVAQGLDKVNPDIWRELGSVSMVSWSLLFPKREKVVDHGDDGRLPVVLVHGLGSNRGTWTPLRWFLRLHGHKRMYAFGYEEGSIEDHAKALKKFIQEVKKVTGCKKVNIVSHSLGGIVSRYAIQRLRFASSVDTLITLATPNKGTYAAQYANTDLTIPLRPDSEMISDLNSSDLSKLSTKFICVYSNRDIYVVPSENMTLDGAENVFVKNISHTQHLVAPAVFREVMKRLRPDSGQKV